jgi:hypothetical protein
MTDYTRSSKQPSKIPRGNQMEPRRKVGHYGDKRRFA